MQTRNKITVLFMLSVLITMISIGCTKVNGDGPVVTEDRTTSAFTAIHYAIPGKLIVRSEPGNNISITAQKNIVDVIETYVQQNELFIRLRSNTVIRSYEPIEIVVKTADPTAIHLSGSGNIETVLPITNREFLVESSGSGNITVNQLETEKFRVNLSGSGKVSFLSGMANTGKVQISGSGQALLSGLQADSVQTRTSGSGEITVWAEKYLDTEISGSGTVRYKGSPVIRKKVSGSGTVNPL